MSRMRLRNFFAASLVLVLTFFSQAEAAKGIKKNLAAGGNQTTLGTIASINNSNGTFVLHWMASKKKMVQVNGAQIPIVNKQPVTITFHVSSTTSVLNQNGTVLGLPSIHSGVRARVVSTANHQASVVQLYLPQRYSGYVTRHRTHIYRPHVYAYHSHPTHHGHHHRSRR